jgi:hypothetical protein
MLIRLACAAALTAALVSGASHAARAEVPAGGIYVTTLPDNADIWVDGTYVGRSPVLVDALPRGRHSVTITKSGWSVRELEVEVAPGRIALSSIELNAVAKPVSAAAKGRFVLRGSSKSAKVSIDGLVLGNIDKPIELAAGPHRVTVATPHGGKATRDFTILPQMTTQIVLQHSPSDLARSSVVAPVDEYLPKNAYSLEGKKIVVRYEGHLVVAHLGDSTVRYDGASIAYDGAPETIGLKLYLPLELLERLTSGPTRPEPKR